MSTSCARTQNSRMQADSVKGWANPSVKRAPCPQEPGEIRRPVLRRTTACAVVGSVGTFAAGFTTTAPTAVDQDDGARSRRLGQSGQAQPACRSSLTYIRKQ